MPEGVSILIATHKGDDAFCLCRAIQSVSHEQTRMPNEVVLVVDGEVSESIDEVASDLERETKFHGKVVRLPTNRGLGVALNAGLDKCEFDFVARMDADDESLPKRIEKQYYFLKENAEVGVVGTWVEEVDTENGHVVLRRVPTSHDEIEPFARRRNPVSHPSVMFRRETINDAGGYPPYRKWQDYGLWALLLQRGVRFANIPEVHVRMNGGAALMARRGLSYFRGEAKVLRFQREIAFLSWTQYARNFAGRFIVRSLPLWARTLVYKRARG